MAEAKDKRIVVGSDHAGLELKTHLGSVLLDRGYEVEDVGTHDTASCDYPDFAHEVAGAVGDGRFPLGVLVCGTGVGMSMAANSHAGVRACVCSEPYSARMSRAHNDANILCMGGRVVGPGLAEEILDAFLEAEFEGGRVAKIDR